MAGVGTWVETGVVAGTYTFTDDFSVLSSGGPEAGGQRNYRVRTGPPDAVKRIALFLDPLFVDHGQEGTNLETSLRALGHEVRSFLGTTQGDWEEGIGGADILVIPELEAGDIAAVLDGATEALVSNFVAAGGCMLMQGVVPGFNTYDQDFLNSVFGYSLQDGLSYFDGQSAVLTNEASTAFEGGPASLPAQSATATLLVSSLPPGSRSFYQQVSQSNETWVADIPEGRGRIVYLGWDWYDAPPQGTMDGGWMEVLERALQQCARKKVGYYDMSAGAGVAAQVPPIDTAAHDPVDVVDLSPGELAGIDVLFVQNPDNGGYGSEYTSNLANIETAVLNGMTLVMHDRAVATGTLSAAAVLPGGSSITSTHTFGYNDINLLHLTNLITQGPGGVVDDTTLDGGGDSAHGYADSVSLPAGAVALMSSAVADEVVTFSYPYGLGWVVYSTIPLDHYLAGNNPAAFREIYAPNVVAFGAALANVP